MRSSRAFLLAIGVLALVVGAALGEVVERGRLLGTGTGASTPGTRDLTAAFTRGTLWTSVDQGTMRVHFLPGTADGVTYADVFGVLGVADGIAASGDRVWLTFAPTAQRPASRDVLAFVLRRNPATGLVYSDPPTGTVLPSLPVDSELVGFVADGDGPWALFQGSPSDRFGVRRTDQSDASDASRADRAANQLLRLRRGVWTEVTLPESLARASTIRLVVVGGIVGVLVPDPRDGSELHVPGSGDSPSWRRYRVDVPTAGSVWIDAAGRPAVARSDGRKLHVAYIRGFGDQQQSNVEDSDEREELTLLEWMTLATPDGDWLLAGDANGAVLLTGNKPPLVRRLPAIGDSAGPLLALEKPGFRSGSWIHMPILGAIVIAAIVAFALARSVGGGEDEDVRQAPIALPLERRVMALVIDFIPAAIVAIVALRAAPADLLVLPSWSLDRNATEPASLAILLTCLHTTVLEAFTGRSIGKFIVGGRVVSIDGSKLGIGRSLVRGLLKFVTMCVPILAVFVLLSPARRAIGDAVARAIVIDTRSAKPTPPEPTPPE